MSCFLYVFQFRSWSDTRWALVGRAGRRWVLAHLFGLGSLVQWVRDNPKESNYYIDGYRNVSNEIMLMLSILALTAQFSEAPLKVVLEGDRLPKVLDSIDQITKAQREAICEFDMEVFNFFAKLSESTGRILCDGCLHSVAVQCGYAEYRLRAARRGFWHLIHGVIRVTF